MTILNISAESSRLSDGLLCWSATVNELPGIVCEGDTREEAVSLALASLRHLASVSGSAWVARTPYVRDARWTSDGDVIVSTVETRTT